MDKKDKEHHIKDARKLLVELPRMECNIDGSIYPWKEVVEFRTECTEEFIEWIKTEKLDHIKIHKAEPTKEIRHFK